MRVRLALKLAELRVLAQVDLDLRITAEADHAGAIVAASLLQNAADHRRLAIERALHAGGEIGRDQQ